MLDSKRAGFMGATNVVNYLSNHDHQRVMVELGNRGIVGEAAFKRVKLGAIFLLMVLGMNGLVTTILKRAIAKLRSICLNMKRRYLFINLSKLLVVRRDNCLLLIVLTANTKANNGAIYYN